MLFDFDTPIQRANTDCMKYDGRLAKFGRADVLPLWVADMDFAAPPAVLRAIADRLSHPVLGYSLSPDALSTSLFEWFLRRHHWTINPAQFMLTPGVVPTLYAAVQALTEPNDGVIVLSPIYPPFFSAVEASGRHVLDCSLHEEQGYYRLPYEALEQLAPQARMVLLCNPHNPVGRVWSREELNWLIDWALRHNLVLVSDDIHCDLLYPGQQYIPIASLAPAELRVVTAVSPSKSFNIPGLNLSGLVASHAADKRALRQVFDRLHVNPFNPLSMAAFTAAYTEAGPWLDALMHYLDASQALVLEQLKNTPIQCRSPEATALLWLDCRALGLDNNGLKRFFVQQAGLGLNDGASFGPAGNGFMRLNIGTQRAVLEQAMQQLQAAL